MIHGDLGINSYGEIEPYNTRMYNYIINIYYWNCVESKLTWPAAVLTIGNFGSGCYF